MIPATLEAGAAMQSRWPVAIVGAGPAGAFAAHELARAGLRVLLMDRQSFPRTKVCGGCLNGRTLGLLASSGLGELPAALGGEPLDRFELRTHGRVATLPIPRGISLSRAAFDAALVRRAVAAGADFLPNTRAVLGPSEPSSRFVLLPQFRGRLRARIVIAADGLGGSFFPAGCGHRGHSASAARIGVGAVFEDGAAPYRPGVIHMVVGRSGYVGVARAEAGRLSVAAALDRRALARGHGVAGAVNELLTAAELPALGGDGTRWRGTAALSRKAPSVAFERVFLIGDAAGYIEPFTGEGISWALESAREISALVENGFDQGRESLERRWRIRYRARIARRQRWCRSVSWTLRHPALVAAAAGVVGRAPRLATPLLAHLNAVPGRGAA